MIRHAYVRQHEDGSPGLHSDSTDAEILAYTSVHTSRQFPAAPPRIWAVFRPEGGDRARLWSAVVNHGMTAMNGSERTFDLELSNLLDDLRNRLVIGWNSPRTWCLKGDHRRQVPRRGDRRRPTSSLPRL